MLCSAVVSKRASHVDSENSAMDVRSDDLLPPAADAKKRGGHGGLPWISITRIESDSNWDIGPSLWTSVISLNATISHDIDDLQSRIQTCQRLLFPRWPQIVG